MSVYKVKNKKQPVNSGLLFKIFFRLYTIKVVPKSGAAMEMPVTSADPPLIYRNRHLITVRFA